MNKKIVALSLTGLSLVLALTGCSGAAAKVDEEIKIPIYNNEDGTTTYETAKVESKDITVEMTIPAEIGYPYGETLSSTVSANLLTYNVKKNQVLKKGDVIATLDASSMDYDYQNQKALANSALAEYNNNPTAINKANYDLESAKLDYMDYQLEAYTFVAPYDCIITSVEYLDIGKTVSVGQTICMLAKEDEIYVSCTSDTSSFVVGMAVEIKQNVERYKATVISCPDSAPDDASDYFKSTVIIKFDEGELDRLLTDTPNAVGAGWATIYVTTEIRHNFVFVPEKAVNKFGGSIYCYIIENGNKLQIPVEIGDTYEGYTQILSGLSVGDEVII